MHAAHSFRLAAALAGIAALATLPATAASAPKPLTYRVTVTNLTKGDLTRIAVVAHDRRATVWRTGRRASRGLADLAEDGSTTRLLAEARSRRGVRRAFEAGRIAPGRSRTFTVRTTTAQRRLTLATMLVCTNDGFTGVASRPLPLRKGARAGSANWRVPAYDAGSERNTESSADVPCLGAHYVGPSTSGRVRMHPGISGRADLVPAQHDWGRYAARIVVRPA